MTAAHQRNLPDVTPETEHFWRGGAKGLLQILKCQNCSHYIHPPMPICACCMSRKIKVVSVSGVARVSSFTLNYQAWRPGLTVPYVIAIVELPEQTALRLTTNIINCPIEDVHIGMNVRVVFEHIDDVWLPLFEPVTPREMLST